MRRFDASVACLLTAALTASCGGERPVTLGIPDEELLVLAAQPINSDLTGKKIVLGRFDGGSIVADHPCSDVCPEYTVRVIHFVVDDGRSCEELGGVIRSSHVPVSFLNEVLNFCVPQVLADGHWIRGP